MSKIEKIVENYLKAKQTDYAILINGPWGSGKTFLFKNKLSKLIGELKFKPIYISLYGINKQEDIAKKIFFEVNSVLGSPTGKKLTELAKVGLSCLKLDVDYFNADTWLKLKNNMVLCFDDLERMTLGIKKGLGYINNLMEHDCLKVIIIANESEIKKKDEYNNIKEKLIGRTIEYKPEMELVIKDIIGSYKSPKFKKYLYRHIKIILDIFNRSESSNIRLLKRGIACFEEVFKALDTENKLEEYGQRALVFCIAISLESTPDTLKELFTMESSFHFHFSRITKEKGEKSKADLFFDKYYADARYEYYLDKSILNYVLNGFFNSKKFFNDIKTTDQAYAVNPISALLNGDFFKFNDKDFSDLLKTVLKQVAKGDIDLGLYENLFITMSHFLKRGLINKIDEETLINKFKGGIAKSRKDVSDLARRSSSHLFEKPEDKPKGYDEIRQLIDDAYSKMEEDEKYKECKKLFELLPSDFDDFKKNYFDVTGKFQFLPIFKYFDADILFEKLICLKSSEIRDFYSIIRGRYKNIFEELKMDYENLTIIKKKLTKHLENREMLLSSYVLGELNKEIGKVCERISKIKAENILLN